MKKLLIVFLLMSWQVQACPKHKDKLKWTHWAQKHKLIKEMRNE